MNNKEISKRLCDLYGYIDNDIYLKYNKHLSFNSSDVSKYFFSKTNRKFSFKKYLYVKLKKLLNKFCPLLYNNLRIRKIKKNEENNN